MKNTFAEVLKIVPNDKSFTMYKTHRVIQTLIEHRFKSNLLWKDFRSVIILLE